MKRGKKSSITELKLRTYKACDWDYEEVQRKANKYANGNISAWLRIAGRMYTPKPGERLNGK